MKKLLIIASFIAFGVAANAQTVTPAKGKQETSTQAPANTTKETNVANGQTISKDNHSDKKECSADEKKACGDMKKGKSCCASKSKSEK